MPAFSVTSLTPILSVPWLKFFQLFKLKRSLRFEPMQTICTKKTVPFPKKMTFTV